MAAMFLVFAGAALARTSVAKLGVASSGVHQRCSRALFEGDDFADQDQVVSARKAAYISAGEARRRIVQQGHVR